MGQVRLQPRPLSVWVRFWQFIGSVSSSWLVMRLVLATVISTFVVDYHAMWALALWAGAVVAGMVWQWLLWGQSPQGVQNRLLTLMAQRKGDASYWLHCAHDPGLPEVQVDSRWDFVFVFGLELVFNVGVALSIARNLRLAMHWPAYGPNVLGLLFFWAFVGAFLFAWLRWYALVMERQETLEVHYHLQDLCEQGVLQLKRVGPLTVRAATEVLMNDAKLRRSKRWLLAKRLLAVVLAMLGAYALMQTLLPYYAIWTVPHVFSLVTAAVTGLWLLADVSTWLHRWLRQPLYVFSAGLAGALAGWVFVQAALVLLGGFSLGHLYNQSWGFGVMLGVSLGFGLLNAAYCWVNMRKSPSVSLSFCNQTRELSRSWPWQRQPDWVPVKAVSRRSPRRNASRGTQVTPSIRRK